MCSSDLVMITAMAAIDMALWDLKGKHFQEPIHRLLGGKQHSKILAYASILFGKDGAQTREIGQRWRAAGYRAVKFGWEPMGKSEAVDLDLVRGARSGLGDDATLLIDAGCIWDARTALRRANHRSRRPRRLPAAAVAAGRGELIVFP